MNYDKARETRNRLDLYQYWFDKLKKPHCNTGRTSIITDEEYEEYVQIFVEYDMSWKRFPSDHPQFPNTPMARTIRDYFDYSAKVHGFSTYSGFVDWKYKEGPWKPTGEIFYFDYKFKDK
jgi:hypothetical protein